MVVEEEVEEVGVEVGGLEAACQGRALKHWWRHSQATMHGE